MAMYPSNPDDPAGHDSIVEVIAVPIA